MLVEANRRDQLANGESDRFIERSAFIVGILVVIINI